MKRVGFASAALALFAVLVLPVVHTKSANAAPIAGETFRGVSTAANQWVSGGTPGACLTAATTDAPNSIPACIEGPLDSAGNGALRLTDSVNNQSGFAFYNTPISSGEGLKISFDMYQYGSTSSEGADGISFFLIDGEANPTIPGALGGSLGYSNSTGTPASPGLVGGYVGVGFDRYGNFSEDEFGTGGSGQLFNSIAVRGSEASGYKFVTNTPASGQLADEGASDRENAKRHVIVSVSTNNIMTVKVDYNDGNGLVTELSGLDLSTINEGTLPETFKFGFAASTGGSNNIHEISGLSVDPADPSPEYGINTTGFKQDEMAQYDIAVKNGDDGQPTIGDIIFTTTLPAGITPLAASGTGWACDVEGQVVTCVRPGNGSDALMPGELAPTISIDMYVAEDAPTTPLSANFSVTTPGNSEDITVSSTSLIIVTASADADGIADSIEAAAPNSGDANDDGELDAEQETVTSLVSPVTNKYAVLETTGCTGNSEVSVAANQRGKDTQYMYPAGLMDFKLICTAGATATVTMYYFGLENANLVLRKYNATTQTYATIKDAAFSSVTIDGQQATKVTYQITDGGELDEDGVANGTIVDPAGPAVLSASVAAPNTGLAGSSISSYGIALVAGAGLLGLAIKRSYRARQVCQ